MIEVIFLLALGLIWILFASVQDLRNREVADWLNFSLIIFALGFRFFWSLFEANDFMFFWQGLIGLGIFAALGNLFYYGRVFAGGDAKLMIALGTILPFTNNFMMNIKIFVLFLILFLFSGAVYGIVWSIFLSLRNYQNFKKEFMKLVHHYKKFVKLSWVLALVFFVASFIDFSFIYFGLLFLFFPYLYFYTKSVDEACMIKKVKVSELTEGDWLYQNVKIGRKMIKASWEGLSKGDIKLLRKKKKEILIRQGIPFVPVFLIAFLVLILIWFFNQGIFGWF